MVAWQEVHQRMVTVAATRAALDSEMGELMLEALRADVHSHVGYATFLEYVERMFGLGPRDSAEWLGAQRAPS